MNKEVIAGNAALGLSSGAGAVSAASEYATWISLSLTAAGVLIGLFFHILAVIHRNRKTKREIEDQKKKFDDMAEQTEKGIKDILNQIKKNHEK